MHKHHDAIENIDKVQTKTVILRQRLRSLMSIQQPPTQLMHAHKQMVSQAAQAKITGQMHKHQVNLGVPGPCVTLAQLVLTPSACKIQQERVRT